MNNRQKKKLLKSTFIKIKKLHPKEGDVICLMPNLELIDLKTAMEFVYSIYQFEVFGEANAMLIPCPIKRLKNKEKAQEFIDLLQKAVDKMS